MRSRIGQLELALSITVLLLGAAASRPVLATPGELLWEDQSGESGFDQAYSVATSGSRVFVAGWKGYPDPSNPSDFRDFLVRTYDTETGALVWQDQVSFGTNDYAAGVVSDGSRVLVSGVGGDDDSDWVTLGYDAETGTLLWENVFDFAGGVDAPRPDALAVSDGRLFVAGMGSYYSAWIVRAYDVSTGALLWQDHFENATAGAESIVAVRGRVIVGGFDGSGTSSDALVRAYDAADGALLWQGRTSGPFSDITTLRGLASDGKRVYAAASVASAAGKNDFVAVAYDLETGALAWQDRVDKGGDFDVAERVAVDGRGVYVLGQGGHDCLFLPAPPSDCSVLMRAYDARRGRLLWEKEIGLPKADDGIGIAVTARNGTIYAAYGVGFKSTNVKLLGGDWLVQAYGSRTGSLLWEDRHDQGGGPEFPLDVSLSDDRLFVAGRSSTTSDAVFAVRVYDVGESRR